MKTSIIIPVHNCLEYTKQCVESIKQCTRDYELIIVDNASTDGTFDWLKPLRDDNSLTATFLTTNLGYAGGMNKGAEKASGDYFCLMNNDIIVTPGWLERLIYHLENNLDLVGPMTNYVSGQQRLMADTYKNQEELTQVANQIYWENEGKFSLVNWIIGFCMVMSAETWYRIGDMDEQFGLGNCEDIDYCLRAQDAGIRIGFAQDVYIHHFGGQTFKDVGGPGLCRELCITNGEKLKKKWGKERNYKQ